MIVSKTVGSDPKSVNRFNQKSIEGIKGFDLTVKCSTKTKKNDNYSQSQKSKKFCKRTASQSLRLSAIHGNY